MVLWNLGSVTDAVYARVDSIPTSISGAQLINIADQMRVKMENFTGLTVGSVGISERFQGVLTSLTAAKTQQLIDIQGADKGFRLGDLTIDQSSTSSGRGDAMWEAAEKDMKQEIGRAFRVYRAYG